MKTSKKVEDKRKALIELLTSTGKKDVLPHLSWWVYNKNEKNGTYDVVYMSLPKGQDCNGKILNLLSPYLKEKSFPCTNRDTGVAEWTKSWISVPKDILNAIVKKEFPQPQMVNDVVY